VIAAANARAAVLTVPAGGNIQAAINAAQPGDRIILQANADYICEGPCMLPVKSGTAFITIESSRYAEIPVRDFYSRQPTADVAQMMARVKSMYSMDAVFQAAPGAHHYKLLGLDLMPATLASRIVEFGTSGAAQDTLAEVPHDFVIDKSWIHGTPTQDVQRCVAMNSGSTEVTNSWLTECHGRGFDTQAIGCWNGPGPFRIINNYLEGAGENVMFGGAPASIPNLVPTGITVKNNYFFKPLSWYVNDPSYAGIHWTVKNLFELKNARQVAVDGNVFEGNWTDAQAGRSIVFTPRPSDSGSWAVVEDVQFTNNIVRNVGSGANVLGMDDPPQLQVTTLRRVRIANNLWEIDGPRFGSNGTFVTVTNQTEDVTIEHNTAIQTGSIITTDYIPNSRFIYRDNITRHNEYGIFGSGVGIGNPAIAYYFPGSIITGNLVAKEINAPWNVDLIYPAGNNYPASLDAVGFVDWRNGNYRLTTSSPYKGTGSGASDPGCDIDALNAALNGAPIPTPTPTPPPNPSPTPSPTPTPTPNPSPTPTPPPSPSAVVSFVQTDATTKGSWKDNYGADGFNTINDIASYPSYAQVGVSGYASPTWAASTTDPRALQKDLASDRIAARWESSGTSSFFTIDLNITDGLSHQIALYSLDWDGTNRSQRVDVMDWASNALLDSQSISQFNGGKYLVWNVKGHVRITVNKTGAKTAVVSGLYFGQAAAPTPIPTPTPTPTPPPLTVAITSPTNNTTFGLGTNVSVTATATDTAGTVTSVKFYAGSQLIGTSTTAPFNVTWSNIAAGTYSLTAIAVDDHGVSVTSSPITVKISKTLKRVRSNRQSTTNLTNANSLAANTETSAATAGLDSLVTDLEQTYSDFNAERSMFNSEHQIETYLLASLLLARSSAALAKQPSTNPGVIDRLDKIEAYLDLCDDLIVSSSMSPGSVAQANKANAQLDLVIAHPSTRPISLPGATIWPNLSARIETTSAIPFATQTTFVPVGQISYELANVSVTIGGKAAALLMVSPTQITFVVPGGLTGGLADVVVTSRGGSISHGTAAIVGLNPAILGLLGDTSGQAAAQEAVSFQAGAFSTNGSSLYGLDSRTRILISASGISTGVFNTDPSNDIFLGIGQVIENLSESVKVEARTGDGTVYLLPVEFAGSSGVLTGLDQVNAILLPELRGAGTVQLTIVVGTARSNTMTINVQ
jgi:uncharacterized protein (TIGR03437 family)